jgi:hypothetical protein
MKKLKTLAQLDECDDNANVSVEIIVKVLSSEIKTVGKDTKHIIRVTEVKDKTGQIELS